MPVHSGDDPSRDVYLEFNFFDGVMVDCNDMIISERRTLESPFHSCNKTQNAAFVKGSVDPTYTKVEEENFTRSRREQEFNTLPAGLDLPKGAGCEVRSSLPMCSQAGIQDAGGEMCTYMPSNRSVSGIVPDEMLQLSSPRNQSKHENVNLTLQTSNTGDGSISCRSATASPSHGNLGGKGIPLKKRVHFFSGENIISSGQQACTENTSGSILKNLFDSSPMHDFGSNSRQGKGFPWDSPTNNGRDEDVAKHCASPSTGFLDRLWSEDPIWKEGSHTAEIENGQAVLPVTCSSCTSTSSRGYVEKGNKYLFSSAGQKKPNLSGPRGQGIGPGDRVYRCYSQSWKDPGKELGKSAVLKDTPRCSSVSMSDLAETISAKKFSGDAIHRESSPSFASCLDFTGTAIAQCKLHNDSLEATCIESRVPCGHPDSVLPVLRVPQNSVSSVSSSLSKKDSATLKVEPGSLCITESAPYGTMHGILHSTFRDGLPNYTFLLDDYEEAVTAKIWTEDMVLGEEEGAWRYTFYSLKGEGKRKGKTGWKHWSRKEKLASNLVGKMKVSSVLCSDPGHDGDGNLSVISEFVLFGGRTQEPSVFSQADLSPKSSLSSLETVQSGSGEVNYTSSTTSSSSSQPLAPLSNGLPDMSSPGAISAWYVSQSLLPSSLAEPEIEERKSSRKWSLQSGISGIQVGKAKGKSHQSSSSIPVNIRLKDTSTDLTWSQNQVHSELAAMIISVPLEMQNRQESSEFPLNTGGRQDCEQRGHGIELPRIQDEITEECRHADLQKPGNDNQCKSYDKHRQANITVILPSGNHGKPLSDSKGPSPLIKRWKDGGKCDCKGWDLGCGLITLSNQRQKLSFLMEGNEESEVLQSRENQGQGKPLTLYKQDTDQEDVSLSLAPQKNGLIAIDFQAPLSPLQAFAIAVAILHGREPYVQDVNASKVVPMAGKQKHYLQERTPVDQVCPVVEQDVVVPGVGFLKLDEVEPKKPNGLLLPSSTFQDSFQFHDCRGNPHVKMQESDVFNCASELALSFERV